MTFTLRTTPEDDQAIDRLASGYGVSRQQAVLRAVRETLDREVHRARVADASARLREQWAGTLDDLARS